MNNVRSYEKDLRRVLTVPDDATADDILELIRQEGWQPNLVSTEIEGEQVWACPVSKGIFTTVEFDPNTVNGQNFGFP